MQKREKFSFKKSSNDFYSFSLDNKIRFNEIKLGKEIGKGSFGKVFQAEWKNKTIACKILDFGLLDLVNPEIKRNFISFEKEIKIYQELWSSNIIKFIGECTDVEVELNTVGTAKKIQLKRVICLNYMGNGTLWDNFYKEKKQFSLRKRFNWCLSLSSGLRRIHSKNIVHKDLKPDNIFLDEDLDLKIGDLGLAFNKDFANELENVQQILYYPSEKVSLKSDIYSMGLIFNELFTGVMHDMKIFYKIEPKSKFFYSIVAKCIDKNPLLRPTAESIEEYFLKFDNFFWNFIKTQKIHYLKNTPDEEKNKVFERIYGKFINHYGEFVE